MDSEYDLIVIGGGAAGMAAENNGQWRRVVIEKPFGRDLESARALNANIKQVLEERQKHFLGNLLGVRRDPESLLFCFRRERRHHHL